ncbi:hypothetical protein [Cupriavidus oxalaticus]|uniref:Sel1 repeat family protein n=1 Tax=Cupriavidus oxalaticus TaxID=96344 RepID=A0A5P3VAP8_9BURK|nr:hypothetical protein [Cupriavidus oxalaticus]QEZ42865.1 hypothetical protein D2917_00530 [Cupriavidus oxalaticus]
MKRLLKGLGKVALIAGVIVLLGGMALYVYSRERHDLPPFDHAKAAVLPAKTRAQYERDLFNEIRDWNAGTPRHDLWSREAEWLRMARDGYELAYITLQVLSPTKGIFAVEKPLARLSQLAESGDAGAMCLYPELSNMGADDERAKYRDQALAYWRRGAELEHPGCLSSVGFFLMTGIQGFPKDVQAGFEASVKAARAGYDGASSVAVYLARQGMTSATNWTRYYCWQVQASQFITQADPGIVLRKLRRQLESSDGQALAAKLEAWRPTLEDCIALKLGDE